MDLGRQRSLHDLKVEVVLCTVHDDFMASEHSNKLVNLGDVGKGGMYSPTAKSLSSLPGSSFIEICDENGVFRMGFIKVTCDDSSDRSRATRDETLLAAHPERSRTPMTRLT